MNLSLNETARIANSNLVLFQPDHNVGSSKWTVKDRRIPLRFSPQCIIIPSMKMNWHNFSDYYFTESQSGRWGFAVR